MYDKQMSFIKFYTLFIIGIILGISMTYDSTVSKTDVQVVPVGNHTLTLVTSCLRDLNVSCVNDSMTQIIAKGNENSGTSLRTLGLIIVFLLLL